MTGCCGFWTKEEKNPTLVCGLYHGGIAVAMAVTGAIATVIATTSTVAAVALTAGLFAAPALVIGALTFTLLSIPQIAKLYQDNAAGYLGINTAAFALLSAAAIIGGVVLGILTPALMITFIVAASVVTLALLGLTVFVCCQEDKSAYRRRPVSSGGAAHLHTEQM